MTVPLAWRTWLCCRQWVESCPLVPEGEWFKDFGTFKLCGAGPFPKTFLLKGQVAKGEKL
jgi:hypothetical protein